MVKQQQVHATFQLTMRDTVIARDQKTLRKLLNTARRTIASSSQKKPLHIHPTLYKRYRGKGFPLKTVRNRKLPEWRSLSKWMKTQLASLCLGQHLHLQIRLTLHDELRLELVGKGKDLKCYMRDRLTRLLHENFNPAPLFFFVIEDLDTDGGIKVRPHAHGTIQLPLFDPENITDGRTRASYRRIEKRFGTEAATMTIGKRMIKKVLKQATGNTGKRPNSVAGVSQNSNLWSRRSYNPLFNVEAVSYAFKNADSDISDLPKNRLAVSQKLQTEARKFWELIRNGEDAMSQWP